MQGRQLRLFSLKCIDERDTTVLAKFIHHAMQSIGGQKLSPLHWTKEVKYKPFPLHSQYGP
jgi:hypothetical protein